VVSLGLSERREVLPRQQLPHFSRSSRKGFNPGSNEAQDSPYIARKLRINERTLEKWEQGRAKPNPQATALVLLVRKYPYTLERLDGLP
jgi:transcriptional regulator with XRE-family HTH domain